MDFYSKYKNICAKIKENYFKKENEIKSANENPLVYSFSEPVIGTSVTVILNGPSGSGGSVTRGSLNEHCRRSQSEPVLKSGDESELSNSDNYLIKSANLSVPKSLTGGMHNIGTSLPVVVPAIKGRVSINDNPVVIPNQIWSDSDKLEELVPLNEFNLSDSDVIDCNCSNLKILKQLKQTNLREHQNKDKNAEQHQKNVTSLPDELQTEQFIQSDTGNLLSSQSKNELNNSPELLDLDASDKVDNSLDNFDLTQKCCSSSCNKLSESLYSNIYPTPQLEPKNKKCKMDLNSTYLLPVPSLYGSRSH